MAAKGASLLVPMADGKVSDLALATAEAGSEFDGSAKPPQASQQVASVVPVVVGSIVPLQRPQIVVQTGSGRLINITQSTPQGMQTFNVAQVADTPITEAVR